MVRNIKTVEMIGKPGRVVVDESSVALYESKGYKKLDLSKPVKKKIAKKDK